MNLKFPILDVRVAWSAKNSYGTEAYQRKDGDRNQLRHNSNTKKSSFNIGTRSRDLQVRYTYMDIP
jgi:hypothetical protein